MSQQIDTNSKKNGNICLITLLPLIFIALNITTLVIIDYNPILEECRGKITAYLISYVYDEATIILCCILFLMDCGTKNIPILLGLDMVKYGIFGLILILEFTNKTICYNYNEFLVVIMYLDFITHMIGLGICALFVFTRC
jgi:hypothetical protein